MLSDVFTVIDKKAELEPEDVTSGWTEGGRLGLGALLPDRCPGAPRYRKCQPIKVTDDGKG